MYSVKNTHMPLEIFVAILVAALLCPQPAGSNTDTRDRKNTFGVGPRLSYVQVRDDIVVPLSFSGPGLSLLLFYERRGLVHQHEVDARLGLALLRDRYGFSGALLSSSLSYRYLHSLSNNTFGGKIFLGSKLNWSLNDEFFYDWDEEHLYWLTTIELGPALRYSRSIKKERQIHLTLSFPVVAMISRPPLYRYYKTDELTKVGFLLSKPHEDLHFALFDTYQAAQISFAYEMRRITLTYTGSFKHATEPEPVTLFTNSIDVTWRFRW
jgi:hypothetical protein